MDENQWMEQIQHVLKTVAVGVSIMLIIVGFVWLEFRKEKRLRAMKQEDRPYVAIDAHVSMFPCSERQQECLPDPKGRCHICGYRTPPN